MKNYFRIMLGRKSVHANACRDGNFIGADFGMNLNLENKFPENWREFNKEYIPIYLENNPGKSKVAADLACGAIHTICKHLKDGDIILSPDGGGSYMVGEISGDYTYKEGGILPHIICYLPCQKIFTFIFVNTSFLKWHGTPLVGSHRLVLSMGLLGRSE